MNIDVGMETITDISKAKHIVFECMKYFKIYQDMLAGALIVFMIDKWDVSCTMT